MSIFTASREQGGRVALWVALWAECDISVSRLPGLETFANFLVVSVSVSENMVSKKKVSVSVSENLVSEKSLGIGIDKFGLVRKVSVLVSENLVSEKSLGIDLRKFGLGKKFQRKNGQK